MSNTSTISCFINVSRDSLSDIDWIVRHPDDLDFDTIGNGIAVSAIEILLFLTALPWNLFVICAIIKKRLYSQPVIMLMLNLAITNILVCILIMPLNIVSGIASEYIFGDSDFIRCKVCQTGITVIILPWISVHTLSLMSVDRFLYLKRPLKYNKIVTPRRMLAMIISVWIFCTILALPPLFGFGKIAFSYTVATCVPFVVGSTHITKNFFYALFLLVEVAVPILTLFTMYIWIMCIIRKSLIRKFKRAVVSGSVTKGSSDASKQHSSGQLRLVQLFGAIFTANLITWLPMVVLVLTGAVLGARRIPTLVFSIAYLSYLSETLIHPILQSCLIRETKMIISELFEFLRSKFMCDSCKIRPSWNNTSTTGTMVKAENSDNSNESLKNEEKYSV